MGVIRMATDAPPPSGNGIRDQAFGGYGVETMVVKILLEVGGFGMGRGAHLTVQTLTSRNVTWEVEEMFHVNWMG